MFLNFIRFSRLRPHALAWDWRRDQRVLLVGVWWFVVGFDFGLKRSPWFRHFHKNCVACGRPLLVNGRLQEVKWHKECRAEGRRMERAAHA